MLLLDIDGDIDGGSDEELLDTFIGGEVGYIHGTLLKDGHTYGCWSGFDDGTSLGFRDDTSLGF